MPRSGKEMLMDLMKDLTKIITDQFNECDIHCTDSNDVHELLREYLNTCSKLICPIPRKVFISKELKLELKSKQLPEEINPIFDEIKTEFEKGCNVNPHLSKRLLDSDFDDLLLDAFKMHHLHLTNRKETASGFFERANSLPSNSLLFCIVAEGDVYFIDILHHDEDNLWVNRRLLEIIKNNWPDLLEPGKVQRMEGARIEGAGYSDEEIFQLRQDGINSPIEIDGSTYLPIIGGGISLLGHNLTHYRYAIYLIKKLIEVERQISNNTVPIREELSKTVPDLPDNLDFRLCLEESGLVLKETNTDVSYLLNDFCGFCYLTMMLNQNSGFPNVQTRRGGNVA